LDGVRGAAILFVLCAHGARFLPGQGTTIGHAAVVLLNLGWCGVQLFFVLSGFLITRLLLAKKARARRTGLFADFYARRALRIFPLYYVVLIVIFAIRWISGVNIGPRAGEMWWYLAYLQNWYNAAGHIPEAVGHFWSLAIEEQFYIVWPLVVIACSRRSLGRTCIGIVTAVILIRLASAYALNASSIWLYHSTIAQVEGLAMGALLAVIADEGSIARNAGRAGLAVSLGMLSLFALTVVSGSTAIFGANTPFSVAASVAFSLTFTGAILYALSRPASVGARVLRSPGLRAAGRISYGLYVIHYPVSWTLARLPMFRLGGVVALLAYFGLTVALAMLSWRFIERPFLALKDRVGQQRDLASAPSAPIRATL
jgi:peptidoglycan/LPS O-acetylase OafA/YrhL